HRAGPERLHDERRVGEPGIADRRAHGGVALRGRDQVRVYLQPHAVAQVAYAQVVHVVPGEETAGGGLGPLAPGPPGRRDAHTERDPAGQARRRRLVPGGQSPAAGDLAYGLLVQSRVGERGPRTALGGRPDARPETGHHVAGVRAGGYGVETVRRGDLDGGVEQRALAEVAASWSVLPVPVDFELARRHGVVVDAET